MMTALLLVLVWLWWNSQAHKAARVVVVVVVDCVVDFVDYFFENVLEGPNRDITKQ